jgi:hypothetical protein
MKSSRKLIVICISILGLLATSCGIGSVFGPTVTPQPTSTPTITNTPVPTNTPQPTDTSTPTNTATPTTDLGNPIDKHLSDVVVTLNDWFDAYDQNNWSCNPVNFSDGMLLSENGNNGCKRLKTFQEGEGMLISFQMDKDSNFELYFQDRLGQWGTNSYKRFGIAGGARTGMEISNFVGSVNVGPHIRTPKPETWYNLLLAIGNGPKFLLLVWERDNPTNITTYSIAYPQWSNAEWELQLGSFYGTVRFDNYAEISFSSMK